MDAQTMNAQIDMVSHTLTLLIVMAPDVVRRNTEDPQQSYQFWHQLLMEPLLQVAERNGIQLQIFLYIISHFWLPSIAQVENNLEDHQENL